MEVVVKSCAIDFQTESDLALNKKLKVNLKFLLSAKTLSVWKSIAHYLGLENKSSNHMNTW